MPIMSKNKAGKLYKAFEETNLAGSGILIYNKDYVFSDQLDIACILCKETEPIVEDIDKMMKIARTAAIFM